jgi:hypothetical protein
VSQLGLCLLGRLQPDPGALLGASLGQDELASVLEAQAEGRHLRALFPRRLMPDPAGAHQVDPQLQLAVLRREEEPLAAAPRALEPASVELAQRRVERLQRRDVSGTGLQDRRARHERVELANPGLDLG